MLIYILKSGACLAILLLFYKVFLEKENMHVFKRFYLLGALVFALFIPTMVFTEYVVVAPVTFEATQNVAVAQPNPNIPLALESDISEFAPLLWAIYFLGVIFFGIKFLKNLFQIFKRIRRNPKYRNARFIQVLLQEKIPPHTFFRYIFLNKLKFESNEIPKEVMLHEETHAREKHSLDVVFSELLQVVFWVNPLFYFYKKAIKLNHEFLADRAVLNKDIDAVTYQNTLLSFLSSESAKKYQPTLPNAINYSSIKKRFTVMKTQTSKKSFFFRSLLLLPLLAFLVMGFSETRILPREVTVDIPMQEGATKEQVSEYNALASTYNAMMQQDDIRIEMSDVERLEYLHSLMTEEQRGSAEPFPDFPEPPPPPEAPEEIEEELIEMEREIERQAVAMEEQRNEMDNQAKVMEQEQVEMERQAELMEEQEVEMEKDAKAMEVERVEMERQAKIMEEQEVEMEKKARKMEKAFINTPQAPPPPPEPKSPLEYVQEMAKQDAIFYYKKKKITSDEAIAILKKNKDLSIDISKTNDERPIVKIDTHF